jgi:biopolymer transport protein TolR
MARVRKQIAQINVVPMIDVMLVLLVIFMVTAPFINPAQVELPSVGKTSQPPSQPLEIVIRNRAIPVAQPCAGVPNGGGKSALAAEIAALQRALPDQLRSSRRTKMRYEEVMHYDRVAERANHPHGLLARPALILR